MNSWNFKAARVVDTNKVELVGLSRAQQARVRLYEEALRRAKISEVPEPIFSGYFVRGSIGLPFATVLPAGNIEYGMCQALHCEETAVAVLKACRGKDHAAVPVLGFCSKEETEEPPTCCGNCRDILLDAFGPGLEFVAGKPDGGTAVVSKLSDLLCTCEEFDKLAPNEAGVGIGVVIETWQIGKNLACDPYSPADTHPERRYSVCIETVRGGLHFGGRDVMCDYHPIYPGRDAVRQAIRHRDPFVTRVVVVCDGTPISADGRALPPHVLYKDRQHLLELNLQAELLLNKEQDPDVYLFTYTDPSQPGYHADVPSSWHTTLKRWLPFPFTARNFGPEFLKFAAGYYRRR